MNTPAMIIRGRAEDGKLLLRGVEKNRWTMALAQLEGAIEIIIRRPSPTRSMGQNAYYWGVVIHLICEHTGELPALQHQVFKKMFGLETTVKLSSLAFSGFIEQIRAFAVQEYNIIIPDPDRVYKD